MTSNQHVKIVYLDEYHSHPLAISLSAYQQIKAIAADNQVCQRCAASYTKQNPMVVRNTCLRCFMQSDAARQVKQLHFIGESGKDSSGDTLYTFIDPDGYVYLTDSGSDTRTLDRDVYYTLLHWGFMLPETIERNGSEKKLDRHSWYVYGDFRNNPVIVCHYHEYYGDHLEVVFLVYKNKLAVEVNKRLRAIQQLFKEARARIEATKDPAGLYHYGDDYTTSHIEESHLYPFISEIVSSQLHIPTEQEG